MATKENKQKKVGFLTAFYRSSTKAHKPRDLPAAAVVNDNKPVSQSLLLKKLENCQTIELQAGLRGVELEKECFGDAVGGKLVEGRKSVSHVETNLPSVVSFLQVKVLASDMPGFMQVHAFRCARRTYDRLEKFSSKHMAYNMKKEFDKVYGPAWHCIVGSNFGSFVTHSTGCFLYFSMEKLYILVFKTKVQRAAS